MNNRLRLDMIINGLDRLSNPLKKINDYNSKLANTINNTKNVFDLKSKLINVEGDYRTQQATEKLNATLSQQ